MPAGSGDVYPKFRAVAVQAAPVFLDRDATIKKMDDLVMKAKEKGADIVVFGEAFVSAFPLWNMVYAPVDQHEFFRKLFENSVEIPGPHLKMIGEVARRHNVFLSVGINEKGPISMGAMWNTNLLFDREGRLLSKHQKLVPTWAEKLTWARGDGAALRIDPTEIGRIGVLNCGENTNPLARFTLLAQGEQVHIATYPPAWPFKRMGLAGNYNLTEAIRIRSAAHSFEGKVFNIVSSCILDGDAIDQVSKGNPDIKEFLERAPPPISLILGPTGEMIAEPVIGKEGMVIADIDIAQCIEQKQAHDIVGYYNRFDIFRLEVDFTPNLPIWSKGLHEEVPPEEEEESNSEKPND